MARLTPLVPETTTGKAQELLAAVKSKLGMVPNMMRTLANAPAALEGYLGLSGALGHGQLSARDRERIALAISQANGCDYCLAAHSTLGRMAGLTAEHIRDSRLGTAVEAKADAIVRFARKVLDTRGRVSDGDLAIAREHGLSEGEITEIIAHVALNVLTNYFNNVAQTTVDFPAAEPLADHEAVCSTGSCQSA